LSLYFYYLAALNRASRAVMISGIWDVVGVLGALSGFLLVGGPAILSGLYEQWRISWLLGSFHRLREIRGDWNDWIMLYAAYVVAVVVFASWFILQGRNRTSIYNVDTDDFEELLRRALDRSTIVWKRQNPKMVVLHGALTMDAVVPTRKSSSGLRFDDAPEFADSGAEKRAIVARTLATLAWQPFQPMRHVSLIWDHVDRQSREEIESRLGELLQLAPSPANPAASWFFTGASVMLLFSLLTLGALIALRLLRVGV
jgi:hypothetical protein